MSLERGTRPGGPRTDEPADDGTRIAIAAVLVGAILVLTIVLAIGALTPGADTGASPVPSPTVEPTASPGASVTAEPTASPEPADTPEPLDTPEPVETLQPATTEPSLEPSARATAPPTAAPTRRPTPTPGSTAGGDDPSDLPRFPGSRLEDHERGRSGDLTTLKLEYSTPARLDRVRRHYRATLRRHGWFVGDVEFDEDEWEIEANRGTREVAIELKREGSRTRVDIELSWPSG